MFEAMHGWNLNITTVQESNMTNKILKERFIVDEFG